MGPEVKKSGLSRLVLIIWVVIALVCLQGYFLLSKKSPVEAKPRAKTVQSVGKALPKTVKPAVTKTPGVKKTSGPVGRIAIVIDDWGYNNSHCKYLATMPGPAGIAILPALTYSRDIIKCATLYGKQPMLHLPLEPYNLKEIYEKGYVLTTDMDAPALKETLLKIFDEMKGVVGVNNHTGSKGSESDLIMTTVLTESRKRGLFFVDSVTSERTVGAKVAAKLRMRIARRDVFLDNRNERVAIERQFMETARLAKLNGYALAIGHDRALTLLIISEQMKKLSDQGYEFISPLEYIKKNEYPRN